MCNGVIVSTPIYPSHTCTLTHTYTYKHTYTYIHIYTHIYTYMHTHTHIYIHIHTEEIASLVGLDVMTFTMKLTTRMVHIR